ncbi:MAG: DUF4124 domain-containing protein [Candidatus Dadabacteria bacterium]|nr:DUF4124 domain-containing protein [Candidatus Dadabacteria bacterium]
MYPVIFFVLLFSGSMGSDSAAETYYKWKDEYCVTHITNDPKKIPPPIQAILQRDRNGKDLSGKGRIDRKKTFQKQTRQKHRSGGRPNNHYHFDSKRGKALQG